MGKSRVPLNAREIVERGIEQGLFGDHVMKVGELRATHRRPRRPYKTRVRIPSKLDTHIAAIGDWLAAQPQLTALAIVGRLSEKYPKEFGTRQHSIVQRLLKALRRKAAEKLVAQEPLGHATTAAPLPGSVDGAGYVVVCEE